MNRSSIADWIRPAVVGIPLLLLLFVAAPDVDAFCGFYVAQGDAKIYNQSSRVVLARDGNRTVLTMASDFQGDPKEFAVVIPVPSVIHKEQVHIGDQAVVDHLAAFSAPRLVEYFDPDPCPVAQDRRIDNLSSAVALGGHLTYIEV